MKIKNTAIVKQISKQLGFDYCGIAKAELLSDDAKRLEQWLKKGLHGKMQYMENHFDKRIDPTKLVEGAKSVITLLLNYILPNNKMKRLLKLQSMHLAKIIMR